MKGEFQEEQRHFLLISQPNSKTNLICTGAICIITSAICIITSAICIITSNCLQIWRPNQPMSLIVSSIVGGVNEQNSIVNTPKCRQLLVMEQNQKFVPLHNDFTCAKLPPYLVIYHKF